MRASPSLLIVLALAGCGSAAPGPAPGPVLHECDDAAYLDKSEVSADRRIGFGTALGSGPVNYAPKCMTIAKGQSVTFVGDFSTHPLVPGEYAGDGGTAGSPITEQRSGATDYAVAFPAAGYFPYYCDLHAPTMVGVVHVK